MIKEAIGFGNTIDEAKEDAVAKLGASIDDDIQFEVVTMPKKKVLGIFGGSRAEVRVFIEKHEPKPKKDKRPAKKNVERPAKTAKPVAEKAVKNDKPAKPEKQPEAALEKKVKPAKKSPETESYGEAVPAVEIPSDSPTGRAIGYLSKILECLGCNNVEIKASSGERGAIITLDGEGLGVIIGRRGETLDSLQYLTSLAANNGNGYFKVSLNIGNYREKREQTLIALANRVAQQVKETNRSRSLEPMNPYERRVIHTAVQEIDGVLSGSVGEGDHRRVVIYPEGGEMRAPRDNRYNRGGRRPNRDRRPSSTVSSEPSRAPKKDSDVPLYGKIN